MIYDEQFIAEMRYAVVKNELISLCYTYLIQWLHQYEPARVGNEKI